MKYPPARREAIVESLHGVAVADPYRWLEDGASAEVRASSMIYRTIARAEGIVVNTVLAGRPQVFDGPWMKRLGITRHDFGIGMTSAEVTELTRQIDPGALREYRDAVGLRTREVVGGFKAQDWDGQVTVEAVERAAAEGAFGARTEAVAKAFPGRPRTMMLSGIALFHPAGHMGEAVTVRAAGGFGTGV